MKCVVIGAGVLGFNVARKLSEEGHDVVVVDQTEEDLQRIREMLDVGIVEGMGSSPRVLREAGLHSADMLVAVTGSDETNIVACLITETLHPDTMRVARLRDPAYLGAEGIIDKSSLSIDLVISPEQEIAEAVLQLAGTPGASDVLEFADGRVRAVGVKVPSESPLAGRPLADLAGRTHERFLVAGVYHQEMVNAPSSSTPIQPGDTLFVVGTPGAVRHIMTRLGKTWVRTRHVVIFGGGRQGAYIARHLSSTGIHTKIIEKDRSRSEALAQELGDTIVLHGDGMDQRLLDDEGVGRAELFVAASEDEKENVFSALLAKRLGARRVVALVSSPEYIPFAHRTGVDVVLSPMLAALGPVLQFVRRGEVLSVRTLREGLVEGIEFIALEDSEIVGLPLALLHMPRGSLVGAVVRNDEVIVPHGETVIQAGDRVVLFTRPYLVPRLQRLVSGD